MASYTKDNGERLDAMEARMGELGEQVRQQREELARFEGLEERLEELERRLGGSGAGFVADSLRIRYDYVAWRLACVYRCIN